MSRTTGSSKNPDGRKTPAPYQRPPTPLNAGSEVGVDTSHTSSDGDLDESSGHESGSPESTRDSRDLSQHASEEQEV
ncbi:hypothetical protein MRX96_000202 [Rhipicephalus microplus]